MSNLYQTLINLWLSNFQGHEVFYDVMKLQTSRPQYNCTCMWCVKWWRRGRQPFRGAGVLVWIPSTRMRSWKWLSCTCNRGAAKADRGGPWSLLASQTRLVCKLQIQRETLPQKGRAESGNPVRWLSKSRACGEAWQLQFYLWDSNDKRRASASKSCSLTSTWTQ